MFGVFDKIKTLCHLADAMDQALIMFSGPSKISSLRKTRPLFSSVCAELALFSLTSLCLDRMAGVIS